MRHVANGILNVWNEILTYVMAFFTGDFWKGLEIPAFDQDGSFKYPYFLSNAFTGTAVKAQDKTPFEMWFPGIKTIADSFVLLGIFFCLLMLLVGLLLAFVPDGMAQSAEHPLRVVLRVMIAVILTAYAFNFIAVVFTPISTAFNAVAESTYDTKDNKQYFDSKFQDTGDVKESNESKEAKPNIHAGRAADGATGENKSDNTTDEPSYGVVWDIKIVGEEQAISDVLGYFCLSLVMQTAVAIGFIRLALELIERYITLCFLYYCAPLATATLSSAGTTQVFVNYMKMILSEMLVIMMNFIIMFAFIYAWNHPGYAIKGTYGNFSSYGHYMLYLCMLIAWTKLGTRLDELLNTLGFTAARTGSGVMGAIMAAAGTTMMLTRSAIRGGKNIIGGGFRAGRGFAGGFGAQSAANAAGAASGLIGKNAPGAMRGIGKAGLAGAAGATVASAMKAGVPKGSLGDGLSRSADNPMTGKEAMTALQNAGFDTNGLRAADTSISGGKISSGAFSYQPKGSLPAGQAKVVNGNYEAPLTAANVGSEHAKNMMRPNLPGYSTADNYKSNMTGIGFVEKDGKTMAAISNDRFQVSGLPTERASNGRTYSMLEVNASMEQAINSRDIRGLNKEMRAGGLGGIREKPYSVSAQKAADKFKG